MRAVSTMQQRQRADRECFRYLKGTVSTKPLSRHARAQARAALRGFSRCMRTRGYDFYGSPPVVRNLSRGRAFFGFQRADPRLRAVQGTKRFLRARTACERGLNKRLNAIIATDRHEVPY